MPPVLPTDDQIWLYESAAALILSDSVPPPRQVGSVTMRLNVGSCDFRSKGAIPPFLLLCERFRLIALLMVCLLGARLRPLSLGIGPDIGLTHCKHWSTYAGPDDRGNT